MDRILLHTSYLLKNHDCVIVPDLGAFVVTRHNARIDGESGAIVPPTREYSFNQAIRNNDGLLVNSIARREGISFVEARQMMSDGVESLRATLKGDGLIAVPGVGRLAMGAEGNVVFTPSLTAEERAAAIGMPVHRLPVPAAEASSAPVEETVEEDVIHRKKGYWYIPVNKAAVKVAASLLVLVAVAVSVLIPIVGNKSQQMYQAAVVPTVKSAPKAAEAPQPVCEVQTPLEEQEYQLIVATFKARSEAENFVSQHADDYSLYVLPSDKIFRVAVSGSDSREDLLETMLDAEFSADFSQAWIYRQPKK